MVSFAYNLRDPSISILQPLHLSLTDLPILTAYPKSLQPRRPQRGLSLNSYLHYVHLYPRCVSHLCRDGVVEVAREAPVVSAVAVGNKFQVGAGAIGPCSLRERRDYRLAYEEVHQGDRKTVAVSDRLE